MNNIRKIAEHIYQLMAMIAGRRRLAGIGCLVMVLGAPVEARTMENRTNPHPSTPKG
jgi:hypothetical protein